MLFSVKYGNTSSRRAPELGRDKRTVGLHKGSRSGAVYPPHEDDEAEKVRGAQVGR